MTYLQRNDLGGTAPSGRGQAVLSLLHLSDAHVIDTVSPARCEWLELLADDPHWLPLLPMHRPQEALTHWALEAHVDRTRRHPQAPWSGRAFDLALSTGDNIDNAQLNELQTYLAILGGGRAQLSAGGGVHEPSAELGPGPWPFWCPDPTVPDRWKTRGYPAVPDYVARASAALDARGLGFAWTSVPGNHDFLRQGTALPEPAIEAIALGSAKMLRRPPGLAPADPLAHFVERPADFSLGSTRQVTALAQRRALTRSEWLAEHVAHGAAGYSAEAIQRGQLDTVIDTEQVRLILLDTNHPSGDFQGSVGRAQLEWLEARLAEVDTQPGRLAVLVSHHGSVSLTNERASEEERLHSAAVLALLHRHPCLVAWLGGHRHLHGVTAHPGPRGGFWEITTASLIDWPSQMRAVEILRHPDDQIEIVCTLLDHDAAPGSLAALHRELAHRFAGPARARMQGQASDGNVRLLRPARSRSVSIAV